MILDSLEKLYAHQLKDLHSAENQVLEALPKMQAAARNEDLQKAFAHHLAETKEHVARLEKVFQGLDFKPGGERCEAAAGIIKEGDSAIAADADERVRDAALVAAAQRFEHYEMAGYGTVVAMAKQLGRHDDVDVLQKTLEEEGLADRHLSQLAEKSINFAAMNL